VHRNYPVQLFVNNWDCVSWWNISTPATLDLDPLDSGSEAHLYPERGPVSSKHVGWRVFETDKLRTRVQGADLLRSGLIGHGTDAQGNLRAQGKMKFLEAPTSSG
jgi:hypothetical protein